MTKVIYVNYGGELYGFGAKRATFNHPFLGGVLGGGRDSPKLGRDGAERQSRNPFQFLPSFSFSSAQLSPFQFLPSSVSPQFLPVVLLAAVCGSPDLLHEPGA